MLSTGVWSVGMAVIPQKLWAVCGEETRFQRPSGIDYRWNDLLGWVFNKKWLKSGWVLLAWFCGAGGGPLPCLSIYVRGPPPGSATDEVFSLYLVCNKRRTTLSKKKRSACILQYIYDALFILHITCLWHSIDTLFLASDKNKLTTCMQMLLQLDLLDPHRNIYRL